MSTVGTGVIAFEEFERLPDGDYPQKRELLEGELIEMPPARYWHSILAKQIFLVLLRSLDEAHARGEAAELGEVHHETGYKLPDNSYVIPDVSVTHANQEIGEYLIGAPAIAIEVISPSNTADAMERKRELYFRYGAHEVWHLYRHPLHFVIHLAGSSHTIREGSVTTPLLPGFELPLSALQTLLGKTGE